MADSENFIFNQLLPAQQQVLEGLIHTVRREAYLMAYSDAFYVSCIALILCGVAALALRQHVKG
ncbi:hypothetical protein D3C84_1212510 [compost metagenome]